MHTLISTSAEPSQPEEPPEIEPGATPSVRLMIGAALLVILVVATAALRWRPQATPDPAESTSIERELLSAYEDRIVVGAYPVPTLTASRGESLPTDAFFVANALSVAVAAQQSDAGELDPHIDDLRTQLIDSHDPDRNLWTSDSVPDEVATALAVQALSAAGPWPDSIDASMVSLSMSQLLGERLADIDTASPYLAADLLPWVRIASSLQPLATTETEALMAAIPVDAACESALANMGDPPIGLVADPALVALIELADRTGNDSCLSRVMDLNPQPEAQQAAISLTGPDGLFNLHAVMVMVSAGLYEDVDGQLLKDAASRAIEDRTSEELSGRIEELSGLSNTVLGTLQLPGGFVQTVVVPYAFDREPPSARSGGLVLLLDGTLGALDPDKRREFRSWIDADAPDIEPDELFVAAALGLTPAPAEGPPEETLDGTSDLAMLLNVRRFGADMCPLLLEWPEQTSGVFSVAVRERAIDCDAAVEPAGPPVSQFVIDMVDDQAWVQAERSLGATQLVRGVVAMCLAGQPTDIDGLDKAIGVSQQILTEDYRPAELAFADWSAAMAIAYQRGGCADVNSALLGE